MDTLFRNVTSLYKSNYKNAVLVAVERDNIVKKISSFIIGSVCTVCPVNRCNRAQIFVLSGQCLSALWGHWAVGCVLCIDDTLLIIHNVYPPLFHFLYPWIRRGISAQLWEVMQQSNNLLMNNEWT